MLADRYDPVTELTITDMLHYCLEHADNNLPPKGSTVIKVSFFLSRYLHMLFLILVLLLWIGTYATFLTGFFFFFNFFY